MKLQLVIVSALVSWAVAAPAIEITVVQSPPASKNPLFSMEETCWKACVPPDYKCPEGSVGAPSMEWS